MRMLDDNTILLYQQNLTPSSVRLKLEEFFRDNGYDAWDAEIAAETATLRRTFWSEDGQAFVHDCSLHPGLTCGYSDVIRVVIACDWAKP